MTDIPIFGEGDELVYIAGFCPAGSGGGTGGFDWFPEGQKDDATEQVLAWEREQASDDYHFHYLCAVKTPVFPNTEEGRQERTDWLNFFLWDEGIEEKMGLVREAEDD